MLVDALDLMGAPVHATTLGMLDGAAVAIVAVADQRTAGSHANLRLREPPPPHGFARRLQERIAAACAHPVDEVAADMRADRLLDAEQARHYGLLDPTTPAPDPGAR
jgi:ATP-dependent Clp protease protease subunit